MIQIHTVTREIIKHLVSRHILCCLFVPEKQSDTYRDDRTREGNVVYLHFGVVHSSRELYSNAIVVNLLGGLVRPPIYLDTQFVC